MENEALRLKGGSDSLHIFDKSKWSEIKSTTQTYFQLLENNADTNLSLPVSLEREVQKWVKRREG